jgi:hypothetical protein
MIGAVHISVFGAILLHLRDPFLAMQSALKLTKETAIITDVYHNTGDPSPTLLFLPDHKTLYPRETWWYVRAEWVVQVFGVLGFEDTQVSYHTQKHKTGDKNMFTVIGKRTQGSAINVD